MMDPKVKAKWVKALRGRKYKQAVGVLHNDGGFCCLGVLCDALGAEWVNGSHPCIDGIGVGDAGLTLGVKFRKRMKIPKRTEKTLINMNDGTGGRTPKSFKQIADYIEQRL